jgi:hypothetical protein
MRFWIREIAGWGLVLLGLYSFYVCFAWLSERPIPRYTEAGPLTIIGIFLFRGGLHLLKVAVAARVCSQANDRLQPEKKASLTSRRIPMPLPLPSAPASRPPFGKQTV